MQAETQRKAVFYTIDCEHTLAFAQIKGYSMSLYSYMFRYSFDNLLLFIKHVTDKMLTFVDLSDMYHVRTFHIELFNE
jgi:hypothetical protein